MEWLQFKWTCHRLLLPMYNYQKLDWQQSSCDPNWCSNMGCEHLKQWQFINHTCFVHTSLMTRLSFEVRTWTCIFLCALDHRCWRLPPHMKHASIHTLPCVCSAFCAGALVMHVCHWWQLFSPPSFWDHWWLQLESLESLWNIFELKDKLVMMQNNRLSWFGAMPSMCLLFWIPGIISSQYIFPHFSKTISIKCLQLCHWKSNIV